MNNTAERIMRQSLMTAQEWTDKALADLEAAAFTNPFTDPNGAIDLVKAQIIASGLDEIAMAILTLAESIDLASEKIEESK